MALKTIDEAGCTGCRICIASCPQDCIRFDEQRRKAFIAYPEDCMVCLLCVVDCPEDVVYVAPERSRPIPLPW